MGSIRVSAEGRVEAPAETVFGYLADMRGHRPRFLPPAFSGFQVESGGVGAGTITRFTVNAGGHRRVYRMRVTEPEPGRVLVESDTNSSLVTTTTVTPDGSASRVRISTTWDGAAGAGGFFERLFAPRVMQGIYADALERLLRAVRPGWRPRQVHWVSGRDHRGRPGDKRASRCGGACAPAGECSGLRQDRVRAGRLPRYRGSGQVNRTSDGVASRL
jgi:hypothetical protein